MSSFGRDVKQGIGLGVGFGIGQAIVDAIGAHWVLALLLFWWALPVILVVGFVLGMVAVTVVMALHMFVIYRSFWKSTANGCLLSWGKLTGKRYDLYTPEPISGFSRGIGIFVLVMVLSPFPMALIFSGEAFEQGSSQVASSARPEIWILCPACRYEYREEYALSPGGPYICKHCAKLWFSSGGYALHEPQALDWEGLPPGGRKTLEDAQAIYQDCIRNGRSIPGGRFVPRE